SPPRTPQPRRSPGKGPRPAESALHRRHEARAEARGCSVGPAPPRCSSQKRDLLIPFALDPAGLGRGPEDLQLFASDSDGVGVADGDAHQGDRAAVEAGHLGVVTRMHQTLDVDLVDRAEGVSDLVQEDGEHAMPLALTRDARAVVFAELEEALLDGVALFEAARSAY